MDKIKNQETTVTAKHYYDGSDSEGWWVGPVDEDSSQEIVQVNFPIKSAHYYSFAQLSPIYFFTNFRLLILIWFSISITIGICVVDSKPFALQLSDV